MVQMLIIINKILLGYSYLSADKNKNMSALLVKHILEKQNIR